MCVLVQIGMELFDDCLDGRCDIMTKNEFYGKMVLKNHAKSRYNTEENSWFFSEAMEE